MGLSEITTFIQDKYKTAKRVLNDVSQAESMTEEATNCEPYSPDARTMMWISEAAFEFDDYWRIIDVLHRRLHCVNFKVWRQSYKALVLLDFLLTHGPEDIGDEFLCDVDVIEELGNFKYVDDRGFNWGACMQKTSERVIKLLSNDDLLREARIKALKLSSEIQGFGSSTPSSSSSSPSSPSSSKTLRALSFNSYSSNIDELGKQGGGGGGGHCHTPRKSMVLRKIDEEARRPHLWNKPGQETGKSLLEQAMKGGEDVNKATGKTSFRSLSEVGKVMMRKFDRQLSLGF